MGPVMEIYLQQDGQQTGPFTEEQLQESVASGAINQFNLARHDGMNDWQPLCAIIHIATPAPKTPHLPAPDPGNSHLPPTTSGTPHLSPPPPPPSLTSRPNPSFAPTSASGFSGTLQLFAQQGAIIGGWTCFAIGFIILTVFSWPFYIHFALFVVALILSIEAMSQHKLIGGLSLLLTTLLLPTLVGFGLLFLQLNKDVKALSEESDIKIGSPVATDTAKESSKTE